MPSSASPTNNVPQLSFEQALTSLQDIVAQVEGGTLSLEETIGAFRQGSELAAHCQHLIADAELRISKLTDSTESDASVPDLNHSPIHIPGL